MMSKYQLFHFLVGFSFFWAFASILIQYDGLYGYNGLIPADVYVDAIRNHYDVTKKNFFDMYLMIPSLSIWYKEIGVTVDAICYCLMVIGLISSSLISIGYNSAILYILCFICYLNILSIGQVFLSFQWDSLLMEVGFLCVLSSLSPSSSSFNWTFRFLAWKLMFLSGVVKLQAQCPTWLNLSALEYHYASQCLPTPLAWSFAQLPPIIQRISVALTLIIEIPLTFLLILPYHIRVMGASIQIALQILIILTGNYAFFNMLTISLMIIVMIQDIPKEMITYTTIPKSSIVIKAINAMDTLLSRRLQSFILLSLIVLSFNLIKFSSIKGVDLEWWYGTRITTAIDYQDLEKYMLPVCLFAIFNTIFNTISTTFFQIWIEWCSTKAIYKKVYNISTQIVFQFIALIVILMSCRPLKAVTNLECLLSDKDISKVINVIAPKIENLHIFNGYGLFRRMTGVGSWKTSYGPEKDIAIVSRPEVILEGLDDTNQYKEIPFLYKPNLKSSPMIIAPYQPRLDWQLWFAALGDYRHNPWLIHLIYKLLQPKKSRSIEVFELLDMKNFPFHKKSPKAIRATLYDFDFTRLNTSWARASPDDIVLVNDTNHDWWRGTNPREYMPPIELENESMRNFLQHHNFPINRKYKTQKKLYQKCLQYKNNSTIISSYGNSLICSTLLLKNIPKVNFGYGDMNGLIFWCISVTIILLIIKIIRSNKTRTTDIRKLKNQ